MPKREFLPDEVVERRILLIRGRNVIIDADLAKLYGVETRTLNQAARRQRGRFPDDFVFQISEEEKAKVITDCDHLANLRFSPHLPLAYTEHGALMAASVLNSDCAVEMSVLVVRAFVRLRGILASQVELLRKLEELENRIGEHDEALHAIVKTIRSLMAAPSKTPRIGFDADDDSQT